MLDTVTIARPYAKAAFEYALANNKLEIWFDYLQQLALALADSRCVSFITNPDTAKQQHVDLLMSVIKQEERNENLKNFLYTLADNNRLLVLPEIANLYENLKAEQEKILEVDVSSFSALSEKQEQDITTALTQRFQRQVALKTRIDESLIGGVVIRVQATGLVIDGSVRGKLNSLRSELAA